MDNWAAEQAARIIWNTWQANDRIDGLPTDCRPTTRREGYKVQSEVARLSGHASFGWKIAATSRAGQKHIGVDGPLAGRLFENRAFQSDATVPMINNLMKVAEAEFAFRMARNLPPRTTAYLMEEVLDAVASMHPAIEIPDSRYHEFSKVGAAQLIADNACANYFVLGPATSAEWRRHDLAEHPVSAWVNGKLARDGKGANVLGDPRLALTWLVNELSAVGEPLRAGLVVTTGTCVVPVDISRGDHVVADFGLFGRIEARFTS
ncbi:MAG TPA: fumarylacetoacetate hydrolase family protein [Burkholderiales bacterium]|nr:fumarylacetoacetate hydrolase family protein [Burkholderiales bacterium]